MGLIASRHVESSWTRDQTRVPCIGKKILNHWTTSKIHYFVSHYQCNTICYKRTLKQSEIYKIEVSSLSFQPQILEVNFHNCPCIYTNMGFPGGAGGKDPPANVGDIKRHGFYAWVRKIPWRKAWHSIILAWRIPWTAKPGRLHFIDRAAQSQSWLKRLSTHIFTNIHKFQI